MSRQLNSYESAKADVKKLLLRYAIVISFAYLVAFPYIVIKDLIVAAWRDEKMDWSIYTFWWWFFWILDAVVYACFAYYYFYGQSIVGEV